MCYHHKLSTNPQLETSKTPALHLVCRAGTQKRLLNALPTERLLLFLPLIAPSLTSHFSSHVVTGPSACLSYVVPCQRCIFPDHKHIGTYVSSPIFYTAWWLHEIPVSRRKENLSSMVFLVATCVEVDRNTPRLPALETDRYAFFNFVSQGIFDFLGLFI